MAIRETLNAKPVTLAEVLSNGKRYIVPPFQRDYAWDQTEWAELWADLSELHRSPEDRNHYLGALVLQPVGQRSDRHIIDGQQRLVTLSLLALAVIARIHALVANGIDVDDNTERIRLLRERFVSTKDAASLQHSSRLRLNDADNPFYSTYLVQGVVHPRPARLKGSEGRLYRALQYFSDQLGTLVGADATGADLTRFLEETVAQRLKFIEILVEDDETAFTVFETLNARGVALGTADLLKNYLFAVASKGGRSDLEQAQTQWDLMLRAVPMDSLSTFLFHKLAGRSADLREKRVFHEVKKIVPTRMNAFDFLREMKDAADIYSALDDPHDDLWQAFPGARPHVRALQILRVEQCKPVLLAAFPRLEHRPDQVTRLLQGIVAVSLRAIVTHKNTGDLQRVYHRVAHQIESGELKRAGAILTALRDITASDEEFIQAFTTVAFDPKGNRKHLVRYLLTHLEAAAGGTLVDFDASDATIEHILPENPGPEWTAFAGEDRIRLVKRLGNLTLLDDGANRALGSAGFDVKREAFKASRYVTTQALQGTDWTPESIRARQRQMAEVSATLWAIDPT